MRKWKAKVMPEYKHNVYVWDCWSKGLPTASCSLAEEPQLGLHPVAFL